MGLGHHMGCQGSNYLLHYLSDPCNMRSFVAAGPKQEMDFFLGVGWDLFLLSAQGSLRELFVGNDAM